MCRGGLPNQTSANSKNRARVTINAVTETQLDIRLYKLVFGLVSNACIFNFNLPTGSPEIKKTHIIKIVTKLNKRINHNSQVS